MKLLDILNPAQFASWAKKNLDHTNSETTETIVAAADNEGLVSIAQNLEDDSIGAMQVLAVLVALDLYFQSLHLQPLAMERGANELSQKFDS